jgi:hypothetical protein
VEITKLKSDVEPGRTLPRDRDVANKNLYDLTQDGGATTIAELATRVSDMESHRGEVVYTNHDDKFTSHADVIRWVEKKQIGSCGAFWDLFSCLTRLDFKKTWTGPQIASDIHHTNRIGGQPLELELLAAMRTKRPQVLFLLTGNDADVLKCTSFEEWGGHGLHVAVQTTVTNNMTKMLTGLRGSLKGMTGGKHLAESLLDQVLIQHTALMQYIERFFKELTQVANFPEVSAWKLIGRCLGGFFNSMASVRAEVTYLKEWETIENRAHMIWTVFRCHAIVEKFVAKEFTGHVVMVQHCTLYLMTERVDPDTVSKLKFQVPDALKTVKAMTDSVDALKKDNLELKRKFNDMSNDYKKTGKATPPKT